MRLEQAAPCHWRGGGSVCTCWVTELAVTHKNSWRLHPIMGVGSAQQFCILVRSQAAVGWVRSGSISGLLICMFVCLQLLQVTELGRPFSRPTRALFAGKTT